MQKTTILLDHIAVKAASRIKAKADIRYYLNGVYVEATKDQTLVVATDGHRLIALQSMVANELKEAISLIIPAEAVQRIIDGSMWNLREISLTQLDDGKWQVPLHKWHVDMTFTPIDALYPNWRKVIPQSATGNSANLNPKYLVDFQKAACDFLRLKASIRHCIEVTQNGNNGALIHHPMAEERFLGVLMPFAVAKVPRAKPPTWALGEAPKAIAHKYTKTTPATKAPAEAAAC